MADDDSTAPTGNRVLETRRTAIAEVEVHDEPVTELAEGQIRLRVEHFAVTANNISYASAGDLLGYWDFFPSAGAPEWGRVPAVGYAEIVESRHPDLAVGGRYHGWFPMAETVTFTATPRRDGFRDDGEHRQAHAPIYRSYTRTDLDPFHDDGPDGEERHSILRVLFLTGFLAEEFFADSGGGADAAAPAYFGAEQVVVLSASSKTAIGFAQRAAQRDGVSVVGLTSAANADFVRSLGWYDTVVTYDDVASIPALDSVLIDMAGNPDVLGAVHRHLGDALRYSMMIGKSHHDAAPSSSAAGLPGPAPVFFFAPSEVERRLAGWGTEDYRRRVIDATRDFVEGSRSWMTIERQLGADGPAAAWAAIVGGAVPPSVGIIASFHG
jgi:hypothetical protein